MPTFLTTFALGSAAITLVVNTIHIIHLNNRLREAEECYDIASKALAAMSIRDIRDKFDKLEHQHWVRAAVEEAIGIAMARFKEDMEEDEDDE